jgi:hypothetical protein
VIVILSVPNIREKDIFKELFPAFGYIFLSAMKNRLKKGYRLGLGHSLSKEDPD